MKKIVIYVLASFTLLFTQCMKDEVADVTTSTKSTDIGLYINEILSTGDPNDWVELYNSTDAEIDLSGFGVSDDDKEKKYTLPSGTKIAAKGYYTFEVVKATTGFSLSSSGEDFVIWDTKGAIVDNVKFPALDDGISYGRTTDGGETFGNLTATKGAQNSDKDFAPEITATEIASMNDNQAYTYTVKATDASGIRSVKLYYETSTAVKFEEMAPLGSGEYKFIFPLFKENEEVKYYIVATDEGGKKTYFPTTAPDDPSKITVTNGSPVISDFKISTENPADDEKVTITINVTDITGIDAGDVNLYYVLNSGAVDSKTKLDMTTTDNKTYTVEIPGQVENTIIKYYIRAKDKSGIKTYYPLEETDANGTVTSDFDHDKVDTWPKYTVAPPTPLNQLVVNELCTKNETDPYYTDPEGNGCDWVELYNGTNAEIDIAGYWFSDKGESAEDGDKYQVPTGNAITKIPAGGYLVIIFGAENASGDMDGIIDARIFIPAGLKTSKDEAVAIWKADKITLVNASEKFNEDGAFGKLEDEKSLGRTFDASPKWKVWDTKTPGAKNQ